MSPLVQKALAAAGLSEIARARLAGEPLPKGSRERLEKADLLALGALADAVRARVAGDLVRISIRDGKAPYEVAWIARGDTSSEGAGLGLLRKVAVERVLSPDGVRVGVSYTEIGIELAQVALGFGASELRGVLANKRGLPIADDATKRVKGQGQVSAQLLQRKELSEVLAYVGRRAVFAEGDAPAEISGGETHA